MPLKNAIASGCERYFIFCAVEMESVHESLANTVSLSKGTKKKSAMAMTGLEINLVPLYIN